MAKYDLEIWDPRGGRTVVGVNSIAKAKAELREFAEGSGFGTGLQATTGEYGPTALLLPTARKRVDSAAEDASHELKFGPRGGLNVVPI